jgi:hypothetical protein
MSLFNDYESEFKQTVNLIKEKITEWKASKKQTIAVQIQTELDVAKDALENMVLVIISSRSCSFLESRRKEYSQWRSLKTKSIVHFMMRFAIDVENLFVR